jgi:hypothetical protein
MGESDKIIKTVPIHPPPPPVLGVSGSHREGG